MLFYIIFLLLWHYSYSQKCPFTSRTFLTNGSLVDIYVENNSKICDESKPQGSLKKCPKNLLNVYFSPVLVIHNGTNTLPHVDLNITVIGNEYMSDVFIQLECLQSPNQENTYCHNHSELIKKWGRMVWPCRKYSFLDTDVELPVVFEQACFRMHGLSQYRMNITVVPQNCVLSYLVTMPMENQVEPRLVNFSYNDNEDLSKHPWSPMITVDDNEEDDLWIRFARKPPGMTTDITVGIFEVVNGIASKKILMEDVSAPKSELKVNIPSGEYLAFVFVDDPDCKFQCPEDSETHCNICPHTFLNFTLASNKLRGLQNVWHMFIKIAKYFFYVILCLLFIGFIVVAGLYVYVHVIRPQRLARRPPQSVEMTARPDVLIIYTDDSPQHTAVIAALAELLQSHANAKVRIDIFDLNDPSVKPSLWLLNAISEAQFVLILFSDTSPRVMAGETLIPRRPFPEMFNSAVGMIIAEINEITSREGIRSTNGRNTNERNVNSNNSALSKFLVARLLYSDSTCIPEFFNLLPCKKLVVPQDLGLLFGYLHGVDVANTNSLEHDADLTSLNQAIQRYQHFVCLHPNWLDLRFEPKETSTQSPNIRNATANLPTRTDIPQPSLEEIAAKYNLELPDEQDDEHNPALRRDSEKFKLIGNPDDISMSSGPD